MGAQPGESPGAADAAGAAVEAALAAIRTPEQAREVVAELHRMAGERRVQDLEGGAAPSQDPSSVGHAIASAGAELPPGQAAGAVFTAAAAQLAACVKIEEGSPLDEGILRATNPGVAAGTGRPGLEHHRSLLRQAVIRKLRPYQAFDARVFLSINHLPHPPLLNHLMRGLTIAMKRADLMAAGLVIGALRDPRRGARAMAEVLPALWVTTAIMEMPVKRYFRRRRPFIDLVRAVVVGRRPASFSFPSGHSAAAFAGATLLRRHYPRWTPALYMLALAVGFSRVYLGAHYPGDVLTGGLGGTVLAETSRTLLARPTRRLRGPVESALRFVRWLFG